MEFTNYVSVTLASTLKFIGGPLSGVALGLTWPETALCTAAGMMLSVLVVTYAGKTLQRVRWRSGPPRRFTRRTRLAVRIWRRSGLLGIALLTPLLLTPIGGTALAVSFRVRRSRIFAYMLASAAFWSVVLTLAIYQIPGLSEFFARRR